MLRVKANITFYFPDDNKNGCSHDLDAKAIIRRDINLNGYLTAGQIYPKKEVSILNRGQTYEVIIEMPFIFGNVYKEVKDVLKPGGTFTIQAASRILGEGKILNYYYKNDEARWKR